MPSDSPFVRLADWLTRTTAFTSLRLQASVPRSPAELPAGVHLHDNWEMKIVLRGRMRCPLEGGGKNVTGPAVVLVPPERIHISTKPEDLGPSLFMLSFNADDGHPALVIHAPHLAVDQKITKIILTQEVLQQWQHRLGCCWDDFLTGLMQESVGKHMATTPQLTCYRSAGMQLFLTSLCVAQQEAQAALSSAGGLVERVEELMRRHYYDPMLSVGLVAQAVQRTPNHLAALFRQERGYTVRQALVRIRMERAMTLLRRGKYSVKEVAKLTGWGSQQYFANNFRKVYGYPPRSVQ